MPMTLYGMQRSANCYKVRLALRHLDLSFDYVDVDVLKGEHRTPDFLAINPLGRVPALKTCEGLTLAESSAILMYLAEDSALVPSDRLERAQMMQWLFFEQNRHEPTIGLARFWLTLVKGGRELKRDLIDDWLERGSMALAVMDRHLAMHRYFAGERFSLADIAFYANTHLAHEADLSLAPFGAVREWLWRVEEHPLHVPMGWRPEAVAA